MHLHSIAAYADKIVDEIDAASAELLKNMPANELVSLHHTWGTAIRNGFGLWESDHPLTTNWHMNVDTRNIIDGVDYSKDHPDSVSMKIMELVHKKINA
jgi:hypothetical protein